MPRQMSSGCLGALPFWTVHHGFGVIMVFFYGVTQTSGWKNAVARAWSGLKACSPVGGSLNPKSPKGPRNSIVYTFGAQIPAK